MNLSYPVSLLVIFAAGCLFGNLVGEWIFSNAEPREIGMCTVTQRPEIFCINGELMVENPNYRGKTLVTNDPKFLPVSQGFRAVCSCTSKVENQLEDSILLGDLKESVRIEGK